MTSTIQGVAGLSIADSASHNPLNNFRSLIADEIARITGVEKSLAFDGLDRTATLDAGDLLFAVPRLRLKGTSPKELAAKIASQVGRPCFARLYGSNGFSSLTMAKQHPTS